MPPPDPTGPAPAWLPRAEAAAVLSAALLRALALLRFQGSPAARHPMVDAFTYWEQAQTLLKGGDPFQEGYYQPPAYPWALAAFGRLAGSLELGSVRVAQALLGVFSVWALIRVGRALGAPRGRPWIGALAGALFGLYPSQLMFEHDALTPALSTALSVGGAWALTPLLLGAGGPARALLGAALLGMAVAVHPTLLPGAVALLGWAGWSHLRALPQGDRRMPVAWAAGLALALGLALPLAPTALTNHSRFGTVTLVSYNLGINLYLGNNPSWRDTMFLRPGLPFRELALQADPATRELPARDRYWRDRAISESAAAPVAWLSALGVKALWSVNNREIPRNEDYRCRLRPGQPLSFLAWIPIRYGPVFALGLAGAAALLARRAAGPVLVWLALHLPLVLFFPTDRYRLGSWPALCLLAAVGAGALLRPGPRRPVAIGAALLGLVLAFLPIDPRTAMDPALCRYGDANLALADEDEAAAEAGYREMLAAHPDDVGAHGWLAKIAAKRGDHQAAVAHLDVVLRQFPDHFPTLKEMADAWFELGDRSKTVEYLYRAYKVPGDRTNTGVSLVKLLRRLDRDAEADALMAADPKLKAHPKLQPGAQARD